MTDATTLPIGQGTTIRLVLAARATAPVKHA
jgi:hypothetical protein